MELSTTDREALQRAKLVLEHSGLAARVAEFVGRPIELGVSKLPDSVQRAIGAATQAALRVALHAAVATLSDRPGHGASLHLHKLAAGIAGAAGGFFGIVALPAELPISTVIMLRAIADVARSEGEDMQRMESRLACLVVLGLGSEWKQTEGAAETGYYAARIGLAQSVKRAAEHIGKHGLTQHAAPPVAELLTRIASRFSISVSEEVVAKAVPVLGAASGAAINTLFTHHFQEVAKAHFTIRRLERTYGEEQIRRSYDNVNWRGFDTTPHIADA